MAPPLCRLAFPAKRYSTAQDWRSCVASARVAITSAAPLDVGVSAHGTRTPARTLTLSELSLFPEGCTLLTRAALSPGTVTPRAWAPPGQAPA